MEIIDDGDGGNRYRRAVRDDASDLSGNGQPVAPSQIVVGGKPYEVPKNSVYIVYIIG
jgi:hypothetical protein